MAAVGDGARAGLLRLPPDDVRGSRVPPDGIRDMAAVGDGARAGLLRLPPDDVRGSRVPPDGIRDMLLRLLVCIGPDDWPSMACL